MQGLPREKQLVCQRIRPPFIEKPEVGGIITPIDLVTHNPMPNRLKMDPDLVGPTRFRKAPDL